MLKIIELLIDPLSGDTGVFEVGWVAEPAIEQELMFFGRQKFYKAPEEVAAKACRAIKENEERGNPASTQVGKVRGQQLCNRSEISLETIKRMKSYLERAETYYTGDYDDNGTIAYDLWGGKPAKDWIDRILSKIQEEKMQDEGLEDACWEGYTPVGLKPANDGSGRMVPNCVPKDSVQEFVYPEAGENEDEFISRCMGSSEMVGEFPDQSQRAAVCYSYLRNNKFSSNRVGFDWEVLKTDEGINLFERELARGSLPVLFHLGLVSPELINFTRRYRIPVSAINMYSNRAEKVKLIKDMGLPRHYDLDRQVRNELRNVAIEFDYVVTALPSYENVTGDTDNMLIKPFLSDCGCMKEEFELLGYVDGLPVFSTKEEAEEWGRQMGCQGTHEHIDENGNVTYMGCEIHPEEDEFDFSDYTDEELEAVKLMGELAKIAPEKFEAVVPSLVQGVTSMEIIGTNYQTPTKFYRYVRKKFDTVTNENRDFCISIEGYFFRRFAIDAMRNYNVEFGHNRQPYSKWLWAGGPNCVHAWEEWEAKGRDFRLTGRDLGQAGIPPANKANNGYFSPETKKKSQKAYWAQRNEQMSKQDFELIGDLEPIGWDDQYPIYDDMVMAQDASYKMGCGGTYEEIMYKEKRSFRACNTKAVKTEMRKQLFASDQEKRMIYTPLMIPNILIPRMSEDGERYFVKFTPDTIRQIQQKFMMEQRLRDNNYEHSDQKWRDIVMVESWIVDGESDKAYSLGFSKEDIPTGTWMGGYKVLDTKEGDMIWNKYIKPGIVRGASVEGNFILNFSEQTSDDYLLKTIINILKSITK